MKIIEMPFSSWDKGFVINLINKSIDRFEKEPDCTYISQHYRLMEDGKHIVTKCVPLRRNSPKDLEEIKKIRDGIIEDNT